MRLKTSNMLPAPKAKGGDSAPGTSARGLHKLCQWLEIGIFTAGLAASCAVMCGEVGERPASPNAAAQARAQGAPAAGMRGERQALSEIAAVRGKIRGWVAAETFCGTGGLGPLSEESLKQDYLRRSDKNPFVIRQRDALISELQGGLGEVERMRELRKGKCGK